jgi:hypothetical protein
MVAVGTVVSVHLQCNIIGGLLPSHILGFHQMEIGAQCDFQERDGVWCHPKAYL